MNNNLIYCFTIITVVDLIVGFTGVSALLWIGYGIYKLFTND